MAERVLFFSVPGLRPGDVHDPKLTPTLSALVDRGEARPLSPTFPCVTSPVQANMLTGVGPGKHGIIANGFTLPGRTAPRKRATPKLHSGSAVMTRFRAKRFSPGWPASAGYYIGRVAPAEHQGRAGHIHHHARPDSQRGRDNETVVLLEA